MKTNNKSAVRRGCTKPEAGIKFAQILKRRGITAEQWAERLGEPIVYIKLFLAGKKCVQFKTLVRFCDDLNIQIMEFNNDIIYERMAEQDMNL